MVFHVYVLETYAYDVVGAFGKNQHACAVPVYVERPFVYARVYGQNEVAVYALVLAVDLLDLRQLAHGLLGEFSELVLVCVEHQFAPYVKFGSHRNPVYRYVCI